MKHTMGKAVAVAVAVALGVPPVAGLGAPAAAGPTYERPTPQRDPTVPGTDAAPGRGPTAGGRTATAADVPAPVWPAAAQPLRATLAGPGAADVRMEALDRTVAARAGLTGLLIRLTPAKGTAGKVRLTLDYAAFRYGYGADWASRLRLSAVPACFVTTPAAAGCRPVPLPTENNVAQGRVSGDVDPAAAPLVALAADTAGSQGDYAATPLAASASWTGGDGSGAFAWSYPMRTPPAPGGPEPELAVGYSSASVDGRMAASNNQPSWLGEGFDLAAHGFVERRYRSCAKDGGNGQSASTGSGDLCWRTDNAILSLGENSAELIKGADGLWHARSENGLRIERRTGASNGDKDGEHWVVTGTDGTQYWFGRNRLPGWAADRPETRSTWTVPVYGNQAGEPCHDTQWCQQAWRWNLDHVVDPFGNTMSLWYVQEINRYARNLSSASTTEYVRGGYLDRVDYGTRGDTAYGTAPMQVDLVPADRCLAACATHNGGTWPDTPWDLECAGSTCTIGSPTFWTTKRLSKVVTKVRAGSAYRDVDTWTFVHGFPDPGDGTHAGLWLGRIGHTGGGVTLPDVSFVSTALPNRVDGTDLSPAMTWWRVAHITTESGGSISVSYSPQDCVPGSRMPGAPESNTLRCYPVRWRPPGAAGPVTDYFHKYVVTSVAETDLALPSGAGSPRTLTTYAYLGAPAWHYTDDDGFVEADDRTWSVWRGYERVRTIEGEGVERTKVETVYFRGMHGDRLPTGTRTVNVPAAGGADAVADENEFAGLVREQITYAGPDGGELRGVVFEPWRSAPTASRTLGGVTVHARYVDVTGVRTRIALDGGRGARRTQTRTVFDGYGRPERAEDLGDEAVTGDERCVLTTYARNTAAWLVEFPSRTRTVATDCATATTATLTEADVIDDTYTSYDQLGRGAAPTRGAVSQVEELSAWPSTYLVTSRATHDAHGRVTAAWDVRGNRTTTAFTPATGGPVTATTETNHLGWTTTTTVDPAWGQPTLSVDANGRRTEIARDGLGRVVEVWLPGRDRSATGSIRYAYQVRANGASVLTTSTLDAHGAYTTSYTLYDGLLRERQTQRPEGGITGGRIITDTFYDTASRVARTNAPYVADGAPGGTVFLPLPDAQIPAQTRYTYDGAGRETAAVSLVRGAERWRTTTVHGGDRVDVTPPAGGIATSTFVDARERTTVLRQRAGSAGQDIVYRYDRKDRLESVTDPAGNAWRYTYDLRGRQRTVHDPDRGQSTMEYNNAGDLVGRSDARGTTIAYTYDSLGRRTTVRDGSATGTVRAEWTYDTLAKGQLTRSTRYLGGAAYVNAVTGYTEGYEVSGRTITIPAAETDLAGTYTYGHAYKVDGSPATTVLPAVGGLAAERLSHSYDERGQPYTLGTNLPTDTYLVDGTGYTRFGELATIGRRHAGGPTVDTVRFYEEGTRRLARALAMRETAPSVLADVTYGYDPAGNVTKMADTAAGDHQCLAHDGLRQLTEAWTPAGGDCTAARSVGGLGGPAPYWYSFTYDRAGNRLTATERTPSTTASRTYAYPAAGAAQPHTVRSVTTAGAGAGTTSYTYDVTGNTLSRPAPGGGVQTATWDAEGRLATSVDPTGTTSYVYDADGNRLVSRDPAGRTLYLPDQELRATAGGVRTGTRYYRHAGQIVAVRTPAGLFWQLEDDQGTAMASVTATTQAVITRRRTPFGAPRGVSAAWPTDKGFVGGTVDRTGTVHLGAREYDPVLGRFLSVDPLIDDQDPQQMHGYVYANSSPATMTDPDGLAPYVPDPPRKKKRTGSAQPHQTKPKQHHASPARTKKKPKRIDYRALVRNLPDCYRYLLKSLDIVKRQRMKRQRDAVIIPAPRESGETFNFPIAPPSFNFPIGPNSPRPPDDGGRERPDQLYCPRALDEVCFQYRRGVDAVTPDPVTEFWEGYQVYVCYQRPTEKDFGQSAFAQVLEVAAKAKKVTVIGALQTAWDTGWDLTCKLMPPTDRGPVWVDPP